jgi:hypothetical protein
MQEEQAVPGTGTRSECGALLAQQAFMRSAACSAGGGGSFLPAQQREQRSVHCWLQRSPASYPARVKDRPGSGQEV